MGKGSNTRALIIRTAMQVASEVGLDGLTFGDLAKKLKMSKSGLFGHFGSREELQLEVMAQSLQEFGEVVVKPAMKQPRGIRRLRALFTGWLEEAALPCNCLLAGAAFEFEKKPGPVQDAVFSHYRTWQGFIEKATQLAVEEGELPADTDAEQIAFVTLGLVFATYVYRSLETTEMVRERTTRSFEHMLQQPPRLPADR